MNIYEFMAENVFQTFFLGIFVWIIFLIVTGFIFKCWNRLMRHLNIRKHGWPPAHCDADGDFLTKDPQ